MCESPTQQDPCIRKHSCLCGFHLTWSLIQGVVVLAGALLEQAEKLLDMGIHPLRVAEGYEMACKVAVAKLESIASTFVFSEEDLQPLIRTCMTTLSSKM